ncbi:MAG: hypothetical protein IJU18_02575 [Oscillospiraceae bacterium]|nr:hypothetical protein [Oscillospiraceae bacterium]
MRSIGKQLSGALAALVLALLLLGGGVTTAAAAQLTADTDGDGHVTDADAVYLLMHTFFPGEYPVSGSCDYDGDGQITDADAIYLLMHTFFPADYPIGSGLTPVDQSPGEEFELPDD